MRFASHQIVKNPVSPLCVNLPFTPSLSSFHSCPGFIFLTPYRPLSSRFFPPLAHFDDTSWGVYCRHAAARIQFYSFDGTVRNRPFSLGLLLPLTLSQGSPSALAPADSAARTHRCQFHGSRPPDGHLEKKRRQRERDPVRRHRLFG